MKLFALMALVLSMSVNATEVPGTIFYKLKDGSLREREVTLELPARDAENREVTLRFGEREMKTRHFRSHKKHGKTTFEMHFQKEKDGKKKMIHYVGTYLRTNEKVLYYGDIYSKKMCDQKPPQRQPHAKHPPHNRRPNDRHHPPRRGHKPPRHGDHPHYVGGFSFSLDR